MGTPARNELRNINKIQPLVPSSTEKALELLQMNIHSNG